MNKLHILKSELPEDGQQLRPKDVGGLTNKSFVQQVGVKFYVCLTEVYVIKDNINALNKTLNKPSKAVPPCWNALFPRLSHEDRLIPVADWTLRGNVKLPATCGLVDLTSCGRIYVAVGKACSWRLTYRTMQHEVDQPDSSNTIPLFSKQPPHPVHISPSK